MKKFYILVCGAITLLLCLSIKQPKQFNKNFSEKTWVKKSLEEQIKFSKNYQQNFALQKKLSIEKDYYVSDTKFTFILIPPGKFNFILSPKASSQEVPLEIKEHFWISKYEITKKQWNSIMNFDPSRFTKIGDNYPIENVTFIECQNFCKKTGFRLPFEWEWEYACKAGTTKKTYNGEFTKTNFSNLDTIAWHISNSQVTYETKSEAFDGLGIHEIGKKKENPWGLYDMIGNVEEWCYIYSVKSIENDFYIVRGGSWKYRRDDCSFYAGSIYHSSTRRGSLGFRVIAPNKLLEE